MIFLHGRLELGGRGVHFVGCEENLGRTAPDHHQARGLRLLLKPRDVVLDLQGQVVFVFGFFYVRAIQPLDVIPVEGGFHGLNGPEKFLGPHEVFRREHGGVGGGFISGVGKEIPAAKGEIVERGERDKLLDQRGTVLGALAQTDGAELRHGSDRLRAVRTNEVHAGHEGGGHGPHSASEHAELSLWRCNGRGPAHEFVSPLVDRSSCHPEDRLGPRRRLGALKKSARGICFLMRSVCTSLACGKVTYHAESAPELQCSAANCLASGRRKPETRGPARTGGSQPRGPVAAVFGLAAPSFGRSAASICSRGSAFSTSFFSIQPGGPSARNSASARDS